MIQTDSTELYPHIFRLDTPHSSYVLGISKEGLAVHLYYGALLGSGDTRAVSREDNSPWFPPIPGQPLLDQVPLEYSGAGMADLRPSALSVVWEDGDNIADLRYKSHRVVSGKPAPGGLPHVYAEPDDEAQTLILTLADKKGLEADLYYTVLGRYDGVMRRTVLRNEGRQNVSVLRVMSASEDLPEWRMEMIHLNGSWARECQKERQPVGHCEHRIESFKGASGHQHNPFLAVVTPDCTETAGEAYGFSLIYSGNFCMETDVDCRDRLRVNVGLNDRSFRWPLAPGESFETPEAAMVYSAAGLGGMSRAYHRLYAERVCRGCWRDRPRPVLLNTWEGVYFDFNHDKLIRLAEAAAKEGVELFVMDDGWFGHRSDDKSSLGDWVPWEEKLGCTLAKLAGDVNRLGMKFGLWVEPEMISPDSNLYHAHPEWALRQPDRPATQSRSQLILDLSRLDVQDYVIDVITKLLGSANISYVKWDMNRNMTEIGSSADRKASAGALAHRYMLGLYRILEAVTSKFPEILFESCAGGGGRFDAGMLYYSAQAWTSDDTDAGQRIGIQSGASLVYPPSMMSCHVSAVPNHQVGRTTPLDTRWNIAVLGGGFGYELNMANLSPEDQKTIREQIEKYKKERSVLFGSSFYRLTAPDNMAAFQQISADGRYVIATCCRTMFNANSEPRWLRLEGLDQQAEYRRMDTGDVCTGAALMGRGVPLFIPCRDFASQRIFFEKTTAS